MGNAVVVMSLGPEYDVTRVAGMRARLAKIDGVDSVDFNYINNKLTVKFNPDQASPRELKAIATRERKYRVCFAQGPPVRAELEEIFREGRVD
jgi:hypothetical protein